MTLALTPLYRPAPQHHDVSANGPLENSAGTAKLAAAQQVSRPVTADFGLTKDRVNGATVRASVGNDDPPTGSQADSGGNDQAMSGDGRYVAFVSRDALWKQPDGTPIVVNNSDSSNIFVRDTVDHTTTQISLQKVFGGSGDSSFVYSPEGDSDFPSISDNGRYVSFVTQSNDIVNNEGESQYKIILCDRGPPDPKGDFRGPIDNTEGDPFPALQCTYISDLPTNLFQEGWPRLSGDGSRLVWATQPSATQFETVELATVLDSAGQPISNPFAMQVAGGDTPAVPVPNSNLDFTVSDAFEPAISGNGRWIAFAARSVTSAQGIVRFDVSTLDSDVRMFKRVDYADSGGFFGSDDFGVHDPSVSNAGDVAFDGDDGGGGPAFVPQVMFVTATELNASAPESVLVSRTQGTTTDPNGTPGDGFFPALSADGRYIAFVTDNPDMTTGFNFEGDEQFNCMVGGAEFSANVSRPTGPLDVPPDERTFCQVVVRDLKQDADREAAGQQRLPAQLASADGTTSGCGADTPPSLCLSEDDSFGPVSMSNDGLKVAFQSAAPDLVANDTNGDEALGTDVFVHTWSPTLTAAPVDFGAVPIGTSVSQTLTLTGGGFGPFEINSVVIDPASGTPGDFTIGASTCGSVVHEDETCEVSITFTPIAAGTRTATVDVFEPDPEQAGQPAPNPAQTVTVTGTGSETPPNNPLFSGTPDPVVFGTHRPLDHPVVRTLVISNAGGAPLQITAATVQDSTNPGASADYTVDLGACTTVAPGGTCSVTISWVGHAVGPRGAVLVITDNAPGGTNLVALNAKVGKPTVTANPGVSPPGRVVDIIGAGFAPHLQVRVSLMGGGLERATVTSDAHGKFQVSLVLFRGAAQGPRIVLAVTPGKSPTIAAQGPLLIAVGSVDDVNLGIRH